MNEAVSGLLARSATWDRKELIKSFNVSISYDSDVGDFLGRLTMGTERPS